MITEVVNAVRRRGRTRRGAGGRRLRDGSHDAGVKRRRHRSCQQRDQGRVKISPGLTAGTWMT